MNGSELAEVFKTALADDRAARKAERKAKKAKRAEKEAKAKRKEEKKAAKSVATTPGAEENAQDALKSVNPELLVEGIGAKVSEALKQSLTPVFDKIRNLESQPARPRLAVNNLAGTEPVMRDQRRTNGGSPMDVLKPLEDAFKAEADPYKREKMGNELTKARFVIRERLAHGQPVSDNDAEALAAVGK